MLKLTRDNYECYRTGFQDGMLVNINRPEILMIAGYTFEQVLKLVLKDQEEKAMATKVNAKFEYCGYQEDSGDRDFLGFIYARLNSVFGEPPDSSYMKRLEKIIDEMPGKIRIGCDCSAADRCPQGRMGSQTRCSIWVENKPTPK